MTQQYKVGQMVKTEGGYSAEILKTDAQGEYPIVALVVWGGGRVDAMTFTESGVYNPHAESGCGFDLIPPEPKLTGFVNVYLASTGDVQVGSSCYSNREEADCYNVQRTHCIDLSDLTEEQLRKWRVEE